MTSKTLPKAPAKISTKKLVIGNTYNDHLVYCGRGTLSFDYYLKAYDMKENIYLINYLTYYGPKEGKGNHYNDFLDERRYHIEVPKLFIFKDLSSLPYEGYPYFKLTRSNIVISEKGTEPHPVPQQLNVRGDGYSVYLGNGFAKYQIPRLDGRVVQDIAHFFCVENCRIERSL